MCVVLSFVKTAFKNPKLCTLFKKNYLLKLRLYNTYVVLAGFLFAVGKRQIPLICCRQIDDKRQKYPL